MLLYKFMEPIVSEGKVYKVRKEKICGRIKEKCNIELSKELLKEGNTVLNDFLLEKINASKYKEYLELELGKLLKEYIGSRNRLERVFRDLEVLIADPKNYYADLYSAIYMGLLHCNKGQDIFLCKAENIERTNESDKQWEEQKAYIEQVQRKKDEIVSVWMSEDTKINRKAVRCNYPVSIGDKETYEGNYLIKSLPGGCLDFHHTILSKSHIGIFDLQTETESYKRYSFGKMYQVVENLKDKPIENLLLMEYSLGIGYANQIYHYVKNIENYSELKNLLAVVDAGARISPFFIRSKMCEIIWEYLDWCDNSEESVNAAGKIWQCVNGITMPVFKKVLLIWWYAYYFFKDSDIEYTMQLCLEGAWQQYFSVIEAYEDWRKSIGVRDWRNIGKVENCFANIPLFRFSEEQLGGKNIPFAYLPRIMPQPLYDKNGKNKCLNIEMPINKIGREVLDIIKKNFLREQFPETEKQVYELYYQMREKIFADLRMKDIEQFGEKDVKIRDNMKKVKPVHIYAKVQKEVINSLSQGREKSVRNF